MNANKKFSLKSFLSTALIAVLAFAITLTVACSGTNGDSSSSASDSASSSSSSTSVTDYQVITNGDFEFGTTEKAATDYPVSSSVNWTRSNDSLLNSATSSSKTSGIIDTDPDVYNKTAENYLGTNEDQRYGFPVASKDGDTVTYFNPRTPEYYELVDASSLYVYDEDKNNDDQLPTSGTKVLMIHNVTSQEGRGTAQKFTSTKTFNVSQYGKISVWVATKDLKTKQDTDEYGAYVQLRSTIDTETNPIIIKNINTDGQWVNLNFYISAHDYATTSFRMVLGLGFGSRDVRQEYVEGYAYFDNVTYQELTKEEYEAARAYDDQFFFYAYDGIDDTPVLVEKEDLIYSVANELNYKPVQPNADKQFTQYDFYVDCTITKTALSLADIDTAGNLTAKLNDNYAYANSVAGYGTDVTAGVGEYSTIAANALLNGVENPFGADAETLYILHPTNASSSVTLKNFELDDDDVLYISFYVKVETYMNMTGLTVSYKDHGSTSKDNSSLLAAFTTKNEENEDFNDFVKVNVFIANKMDDGETRYFDLVFDLGTTDTVTEYNKLTKGYAVITDFAVAHLSQEEYNKAESGTYTVMGSLGADKPNGADGDESEDSYVFNYAATNKTNISDVPADNVIGYTGVIGNHTMVGGTATAYRQDSTVSGIINSKYLANYTAITPEEATAIEALEKDGENEYLQALMIKNTQATAYGYLSSSRTITAGSTSLVSVKVKVLGNATACVYLVNADSLMGFDVLDLTAYSYAYDAAAGTLTVSETETLFSKQFVQTVNAAESADGWVTVNFLITAGESDIEYRIELWNGSRDGSVSSEGLVLFDGSTTTSLADSTTFISQIKADFDEQPETVSYTRVPTTVNYTDDNGNDAVRYKTYAATDVYTEYKQAKTVVASYATIDVTNEESDADEEETDDSASDSAATTDESGSTVAWLQITSVIIAGVLVLVLVIVGVRLLFKNKKKDDKTAETYYSRDSRERAQQIINANKAKREAAAAKKAENADAAPADAEPVTEEAQEEPEALPEYDYENMENNIPEDAVEETPTENGEEKPE